MVKITNALLSSSAILKEHHNATALKLLENSLNSNKAYMAQLVDLDPMIKLQKEMEKAFSDPMKKMREQLETISSPWLQINKQMEESLKPFREFQKQFQTLAYSQQILNPSYVEQLRRFQSIAQRLSEHQIVVEDNQVLIDGKAIDEADLSIDMEILPSEESSPEKALQWVIDWIENLKNDGLKILFYIVLTQHLTLNEIELNIAPIENLTISNEFNFTFNFNSPIQSKDEVPKDLRSAKKEVQSQSKSLFTEESLSQHRFVTVDVLNVRHLPSSKSDILNEIYFGKVVRIKSTSESRSWSEIEYRNNDGEVVSGWVFTRYLKNFK